jgi:WD40 repeat protein
LFDDVTQPLTMDFNMTYETLAVAGYNDEIKIYDVATKKLVNTLERSSSTQTNGHSSRIYCVKYNGGDKNQLVSGGWDDTLQVWDHRCPDSQNFVYGPHICGETLDIDADHNHLLCGSWRKNNTLQVSL